LPQVSGGLERKNAISGRFNPAVPPAIHAITAHQQRRAMLGGKTEAGLGQSSQVKSVIGEVTELTEAINDDALRASLVDPLGNKPRDGILLHFGR